MSCNMGVKLIQSTIRQHSLAVSCSKARCGVIAKCLREVQMACVPSNTIMPVTLELEESRFWAD